MYHAVAYLYINTTIFHGTRMPVNAGKLSNYTSVATNVNYIKVTFFCNATSHYSKVAPRQEILKKTKQKKTCCSFP